jgi:peptidoglycan biosynthesis protein MviN/MurJ (putative lipid II flippase)
MAKRLVSYKHTFINSMGTFFSRLTGILKQTVVNRIFGGFRHV